MSTQNDATETKREPFKVQIDEHFDFSPIASSRYITSNKFCALVSELMRNIFVDFEGSSFAVTPGMEPTIDLIFNHGDYEHDGKNVFAVERANAKSVGSTVIDRGRTRDAYTRDGDRYYLTDDGKDFVKDLLIRKMYNNGNPDYRKIVSEFIERGPVNSYFVQSKPQYTKVSFISLNRLCALLFGSKDAAGEPVEYTVNVASPLPGYQINGSSTAQNYVLNIQQIDSKELAEFCNSIGLGTSNLNIVR